MRRAGQGCSGVQALPTVGRERRGQEIEVGRVGEKRAAEREGSAIGSCLSGGQWSRTG